MNKLLPFLFFFSSIICIAQNECFYFELKHHPNSKYSSRFENSIKFRVEKKADNETLKYFDSVGIKKIQKGKKTESYNLETLTKERNATQSIPIEITASGFNYNATLNNKKISDSFKTKTLKAKGYINSDNNLSINELLIDNNKIDRGNEFKRKIENREIVLKFPKHKIEIGNSVLFNHTIYYNTTLKEDNLYSSNCLATLIKVKKGIAYFKISSDKTFENNDYKMIVNGFIKFDIEQNFACSSSIKSSLHINEVIDEGIIFKHDYFEEIKTQTKLKM